MKLHPRFILHRAAAQPLMACALIFSVAGCSDAADDHGARVFSESLLESPCALVTPAMLSEQLDVPADKVEQTPLHIMGTASCSSEWKGDGTKMTVEMRLRTFEKVEQTAQRFENATRSTTQEEMQAAADQLKGETESDSDPAAEGLLSAIAQQSTAFEDVANIGDEARFDREDGSLVVRVGNLMINLKAYHGEGMPIPDEMTAKALLKANKEWTQKTIATRQQQAIAVSRAVVADL